MPAVLPMLLDSKSGRQGYDGSAEAPKPSITRDLRRSASTSSLPNPHDNLMSDLQRRSGLEDERERELPPLPAESDTPRSSDRTSLTTFDSRIRYPSLTAPHRNLARETTQNSTSSRVSTASTLHSEMVTYQKRLEAHHEKAMQARDDIDELDAEGSGAQGIPREPPPSYQEEVPDESTIISDIGHSALH